VWEADGVVDRVRDQIRIVRFTACIVDNDHRNLDAGFLNGGDQRVDLIVCKVRFRQDTHIKRGEFGDMSTLSRQWHQTASERHGSLSDSLANLSGG